MRYRATLAYDGSAYFGFQRQAGQSTVQAAVEDALQRFAGRRVALLSAGRTDTGVHATGQVIAFDLDWSHTPGALCKALNANLPQDIAVRDVRQAAPGFHPRYDARARTYVYRLYVSPVRDPLRRLRAWHLRLAPDLTAMREAASCLVGTHDFSAFGTPPQGGNPVRTVVEARWHEAPGQECHFTITANAFLYRMVRTLVGTLVEVGQGRMTPEVFRGILAACERGRAAPPAPAHGLTLVAVDYEET
jgi:tRNA pseudouridine38-40 synthase